MLELTTKFAAITTSPAARGGGVPAALAVAKALAHLRYITRPSAIGERALAGLDDAAGANDRAAFRDRVKAAAKRGGKLGARVLEKGVISLPNGWPAEARGLACERIAKHLAPEGSEAMALVVSHRDRARNAHLHFAAVDGAESREAATARAPGAKRIRRRNVIRLSEGGRPKELRAELAAIINGIAKEHGLEEVEWRSFEARGIARKPKRHAGPRRIAIAEKAGVSVEVLRADQELHEWLTSNTWAEPIDALFGPPTAPPEPRRGEIEGVEPSPPSQPSRRRPRKPTEPVGAPPQPSAPARRRRLPQRLRDRIRSWVKGRPPRSR